MSGHSYTAFLLAQEQKERLRILDAIRRQEGEANELRAAIHDALAGAAEGIKATFAREVASAERWMSRSTLTVVSPQASIAEATSGQAERQRTIEAGRAAHRELLVALTRKADEMGRHLGAQLVEVESGYLECRGLVKGWFPEEATAFDRSLDQARMFLASGHYGDLEPLLARLSAERIDANTRASTLEEQHQQRLYVLQALLQTCRKFRFRILEEPAEDALGPSIDPLIVRVDTLDKGKIDFTLSLDKIESNSNMISSYCPREFGLLSERLKQNFGVMTKFEVGEEDAPPIGLARDELDLPGLASKGL